MSFQKSTKPGLIVLVLLSTLAEGQSAKVNVPIMTGMRSTKAVPLAEALEKSDLCDSAKMGLDLMASMEQEKGSEFKVYKTSKTVVEVLDFYVDFAKKNGMPDATRNLWDNTKGKEEAEKPKDSSGSITFSFDMQNEKITVSIGLFRAEKEKTTTVYMFMPPAEKKKP